MTTRDEARRMIGNHLLAADDEDIGTIGEVYLDDRTHDPEFVSVKGGLFGMRERLVPLQGSRVAGDRVRVPFDKQMIKDAPNSGAGRNITPQESAEIYRHYGITRADLPQQGRGPSGQGQGTQDADRSGRMDEAGTRAGPPDARGRQDPDEVVVTRSEEQMHVGKERQESDRVHVQKRVESEQVERTVPVSHEEVRVEREPITDAERTRGDDIAEDDQEMILHEEHPVVSTESVPVERVRIAKDEVQDDQTVRGEVRKEHVDVTREHDDEPGEGPARS